MSFDQDGVRVFKNPHVSGSVRMRRSRGNPQHQLSVTGLSTRKPYACHPALAGGLQGWGKRVGFRGLRPCSGGSGLTVALAARCLRCPKVNTRTMQREVATL
jgi:hypothetical protein